MYQGYKLKDLSTDLCSQLKKEKWKTCHPSGDKNESIPVCSINMDEDILIDLYQRHNQCNNLRLMENISPCFSSKDKGHIKAQILQKEMADTCLTLWHEKQSNKKTKVSEKERTARAAMLL